MNIIIATLFTAIVMFFMFCCYSANAGPYIEAGLGVPLSPVTGYMPDGYGILSVGYVHRVDSVISFDLAGVHRSLTGPDYCNGGDCNGDNVVEFKARFEF